MELSAVDLGQSVAQDQRIIGLLAGVETDNHFAHIAITSRSVCRANPTSVGAGMNP